MSSIMIKLKLELLEPIEDLLLALVEVLASVLVLTIFAPKGDMYLSFDDKVSSVL